MLNYDDYVAVFNTGDDAALVDRFFAEDVAFSGGTRDYRGKAALKAFLDWAHDGVREVMRPQNVLQRADLIFVEADMDFHAVKERPDFPFGHLYPGDTLTVKFFVTYRLRAGKFVELKSMTWPPGKGVTSLPRLGGHASQQAAFRAYVAAFSNADFERFPRFYTEDVWLEPESGPPLVGRQAVIDFYRSKFRSVRALLTINSVQATDLAIELDAIDAEGRMLVSYQLRDGLICRILVRRGALADPLAPAVAP
jgi:ketosteroid isomerase-like protein